MRSSSVQKRVVVCVDGTWYHEDGTGAGNNSNVFRIYASIKRGRWKDDKNNLIEQDVKYYAGIGSGEKGLDKFNAGITGKGCRELIEKVYWDCLDSAGPDDEVWLYGFSRGAFIVRAVAALLHTSPMIAPTTDKEKAGKFDRMKSFLGPKKDRNDGGREFRHRLENGRQPPKIRFLGLFDTVEQISAAQNLPINDLFNIGPVAHVRHALALNEERASFPLLPFRPKAQPNEEGNPNFLEAWFVGSHADMGGGSLRDGLSLYPLQWMLFESKRLGLHLEHNPVSGASAKLVTDPLQLVFHPEAQPWIFRYSNNIEITMFDLRPSHAHGNLQKVQVKARKLEKSAHEKASFLVRINYGTFSRSALGKRRVFSPGPSGELGHLVGYASKPSCGGVIVHPSVYFLLDTYATLGIEEALKSLKPDLEPYRERHLWYSLNDARAPFDPWVRENIVSGPRSICRILVCGNNGIGKSTLINEVFGIPVTPASEGRRGVHNIDEGFENDNFPGIIVHDSEGFQPGNLEETRMFEKFLQRRSSKWQPDFENLHAIWLCVQADTARPVEKAASEVLRLVNKHAPTVPVVIVGTKKDKFMRDYRAENPTSTEPENVVLEKLGRKWISLYETDKLTAELWPLLAGNVRFLFVSQLDPESVIQLIRATIVSLDADTAKEGIVNAQILDVDSKISQAIDKTMTILRATVSAATFGSITVVGSTISTPTMTRLLCDTIAHNCFGIPNKRIDELKLTQVLDEVMWRNLTRFMAQSLGQSTFIWGGVTALTIFTLIGGIPLAAGAPLLEAPAAARMVTKCACDLILVLDQSFRDGSLRKGLTTEKLKRVAQIYAGERTFPVTAKRGAPEVLMTRRRAVHRAIHELFPAISSLALDNYRGKSLTKYRDGLRKIIADHRFPIDLAKESSENLTVDGLRLSERNSSETAIPEDEEDMAEFLNKT